jgi:VWFA-related protein
MKHRLALALVAATLIAMSGNRAHAQTPMPPPVALVEIAQVNNSAYPEVTLYVRVTDANGARVNGLIQENFVVTEDGVAVPLVGFSGVNTQPILTLLVLDKSNSMGVEDKLEGAKQASLTFVDLMRPQDKAGFVAFDNGVNLLQDFTSDHNALKAQINSVTPGDCTSWYEAIYFSSGLMAQQSGRKSIILLSDGIDCREDFVLHELQGYGSYHSFEEAVTEARKAETPVYTIGLGKQPAAQFGAEGYDEGRLTRMAVETGGKFYHAPTADELGELYRTLSEETQSEYVLTYRSPRPTYDGTRRNLQVTVTAGNTLGASGSGSYLEEHLVNIRSDWRVAAIFAAPILVAMLVPFAFTLRRTRTPAQPHASASTVCAHCGNLLRSGAKFCARCGSPVGAQRALVLGVCPQCHSPLRAGARYCARCGTKI